LSLIELGGDGLAGEEDHILYQEQTAAGAHGGPGPDGRGRAATVELTRSVRPISSMACGERASKEP